MNKLNSNKRLLHKYPIASCANVKVKSEDEDEDDDCDCAECRGELFITGDVVDEGIKLESSDDESVEPPVKKSNRTITDGRPGGNGVKHSIATKPKQTNLKATCHRAQISTRSQQNVPKQESYIVPQLQRSESSSAPIQQSPIQTATERFQLESANSYYPTPDYAPQFFSDEEEEDDVDTEEDEVDYNVEDNNNNDVSDNDRKQEDINVCNDIEDSDIARTASEGEEGNDNVGSDFDQKDSDHKEQENNSYDSESTEIDETYINYDYEDSRDVSNGNKVNGQEGLDSNAQNGANNENINETTIEETTIRPSSPTIDKYNTNDNRIDGNESRHDSNVNHATVDNTVQDSIKNKVNDQEMLDSVVQFEENNENTSETTIEKTTNQPSSNSDKNNSIDDHIAENDSDPKDETNNNSYQNNDLDHNYSSKYDRYTEEAITNKENNAHNNEFNNPDNDHSDHKPEPCTSDDASELTHEAESERRSVRLSGKQKRSYAMKDYYDQTKKEKSTKLAKVVAPISHTHVSIASKYIKSERGKCSELGNLDEQIDNIRECRNGWKCTLCCRAFGRKVDTVRHLKTHYKYGHKCTWSVECNFFCTKIKEVLRHVWTEHWLVKCKKETKNYTNDPKLGKANMKTIIDALNSEEGRKVVEESNIQQTSVRRNDQEMIDPSEHFTSVHIVTDQDEIICSQSEDHGSNAICDNIVHGNNVHNNNDSNAICGNTLDPNNDHHNYDHDDKRSNAIENSDVHDSKENNMNDHEMIETVASVQSPEYNEDTVDNNQTAIELIINHLSSLIDNDDHDFIDPDQNADNIVENVNEPEDSGPTNVANYVIISSALEHDHDYCPTDNVNLHTMLKNLSNAQKLDAISFLAASIK